MKKVFYKICSYATRSVRFVKNIFFFITGIGYQLWQIKAIEESDEDSLNVVVFGREKIALDAVKIFFKDSKYQKTRLKKVFPLFFGPGFASQFGEVDVLIREFPPLLGKLEEDEIKLQTEIDTKDINAAPLNEEALSIGYEPPALTSDEMLKKQRVGGAPLFRPDYPFSAISFRTRKGENLLASTPLIVSASGCLCGLLSVGADSSDSRKDFFDHLKALRKEVVSRVVIRDMENTLSDEEQSAIRKDLEPFSVSFFDKTSQKLDIAGSAVKGISTLGISLGITMVLSLALRLYLPRVLGVETLGVFYFSESFAQLFFAFLPIGLSVYISREVPPNHDHAKKITRTIIYFQAFFASFLGIVMLAAVKLLGHDLTTLVTVGIMGVYVAFLIFQMTIFKRLFLCLEQTRLVAVVDVVVKVVLVSSAMTVLFLYKNLYAVAACFALSEIVGFSILLVNAFRQKIVSQPFDFTLLRTMIRKSLPYFLTGVFITVYGNIDTAMLAEITNISEVGFFGASVKLKGVFLVVIPILASVLQPLLSKLYKRNVKEFGEFAQSIMSYLIALSLPLSMGMMIFCDQLVSILYGAGFEASFRTVSYLAPVLAITYMNFLLGLCVNLSTDGKRIAVVMGLSIVLNISLNTFFMIWGLDRWGVGGGGTGGALTTLASEVFVFAYMIRLVPFKTLTFKISKNILLLLLPCVAAGLLFEEIIQIDPFLRCGLFAAMLPVYMFGSRMITISELRHFFLIASGKKERSF